MRTIYDLSEDEIREMFINDMFLKEIDGYIDSADVDKLKAVSSILSSAKMMVSETCENVSLNVHKR